MPVRQRSRPIQKKLTSSQAELDANEQKLLDGEKKRSGKMNRN